MLSRGQLRRNAAYYPCRPVRDSVAFIWAHPGLTSGANECRPYRDWGGVVRTASFPHATSPQTFVPAPNPRVAQANYIGPSSGRERPPQDDNVLCASGGGPGASVGGLRTGQSAGCGCGRGRRGVRILRSTSRDCSRDASGRGIICQGYESAAARFPGNPSLF